MKKWRINKILKIIAMILTIIGLLWAFLPSNKALRNVENVQVKVNPVAPHEAILQTDPHAMPEERGESTITSTPKIVPLIQEHRFSSSEAQGPYKIAILIDDMGLDLKGSTRALNLPSFISLSFLPYATRLSEQTREARQDGHELLLHIPMEPLGHSDPGPGALLVDLSPAELKQRLDSDLASFVGFDGANNHMGSKFTSDSAGMKYVINELQQRHLFFLDSRTTPKTVGETIARQQGVPTIARDIFLDDDESLAAIQRQLRLTEQVAKHKGYAVAIGHPHATTLDALEKWIPYAQKNGFILVPIHDLIHHEGSGSLE